MNVVCVHSNGDSRGDNIYSPNEHNGVDDVPDAAVDLTNNDNENQEEDNIGQQINYSRADVSFC